MKWGGQRISLANEISRTLDKYSNRQCFDELLQNADDAGAEEAAFVLDRRSHPARTLLNSEGGTKGRMEELQGPALLMFDSATFKERDFEGVMNFGRGSKRYDPTSTGMFGLGFNSVFHITEAPQFFSGRTWVCLDPQERYLPHRGGVRAEIDSLDVLGSHADQFAPFELPTFGLSLRKMKEEDEKSGKAFYGGTVFRLPLRTMDQAAVSELCRGMCLTMDMMQEQLKQAGEQLPSKMLFLNHLKSVKVYDWGEADESPTLLYKVVLSGADLNRRNELNVYTRARLEKWSSKKKVDWRNTPEATKEILSEKADWPSSTVRMKVEWSAPREGKESVEEWWVLRRMGQQQAMAMARNTKVKANRIFFPALGVAARVDDGAVSRRNHAYATLQLPVETGYPVLVSAQWCLNDSRTGVVTGQAESNALLVQWNRALVYDMADPWLSLISALKEKVGDKLYRFFPVPPRSDDHHLESLWGGVLQPFYQGVSTLPLLRLRGTGKWVDASAQPYYHPYAAEGTRRYLLHSLQSMKPSHTLRGMVRDLDRIPAAMVRDGCTTILDVPAEICLALRHYVPQCKCRTLDPAFVRAFYRKARNKSFTGLRDLRTTSLVLSYALTGLSPEEVVKEMEGLPLLLTRDLQRHPLKATTPPFFLLHTERTEAVRKSVRSHQQLLAGCERYLVHRSVAKYLQEWVAVFPDVMLRLGIAPFSPSSLHRMPGFLPSDLCGGGMKPWCPAPSGCGSPSWMVALWEFMAESKSLVDKTWRVIPVALRGVLHTVTVEDAPCVVLLAEEDSEIVPILTRIGVPALSTAFVKDERRRASLEQSIKSCLPAPTGASLLTALTGSIDRLRTVDLDMLTPRERAALITYCSCVQLDEKLLLRIKALPVFETTSGDFIRLSDYDQVYAEEESESIPSNLANRCVLLRQFPHLRDLYAKLKVITLTKDRLYLDFIFPAVQRGEYSRAEVWRHMQAVYLNLPKIRGNAALLDKLKNLPIFPTPSGVRPASGCYGIQHLFARVFPNQYTPSEPPEGWSEEDYVNFMFSAGVRCKFTHSSLKQVAESLVVQGQTAKESQREEIHTTAVLWLRAVSNAGLEEKELQQLGEMAVAVPGGSAPKATLVPYKGAVVNTDAWSQTPLVSVPQFCSDELLRSLGATRYPTEDQLLQHLRHICSKKWSVDSYDDVQRWISRTAYTLSINHTLAKINNATDRVVLLARGLQKGEHLAFTTPETVFPECEVVIEPFVYPYHAVCMALLWATAKKPSARYVVRCLAKLQQTEGSQLSASQMATVKGLLNLYAADSDEAEGEVLVPGRDRVLRTASSLVFNDAEWWENRIVLDALPLVHPDVPSPAKLGVRPLSKEVQERLAPGFVPTPAHSAVVDKANRIMLEGDFYLGLRGLVQTEGNNNDEAIKAVNTILNTRIEGCHEIRSQFVWKAGGRENDVTRVATGSDHLMSQGKLYVTVQRGEAGVLDSVVHSFSEALGVKVNTYVLSRILQCEPGEVFGMLQRNRVSPAGAATLAGTLCQDPGTLVPMQDKEVTPNALVFVRRGGELRRAVVLTACPSSQGMWKVQVSEKVVESLPSSALLRTKTVEELQHDAQRVVPEPPTGDTQTKESPAGRVWAMSEGQVENEKRVLNMIRTDNDRRAQQVVDEPEGVDVVLQRKYQLKGTEDLEDVEKNILMSVDTSTLGRINTTLYDMLRCDNIDVPNAPVRRLVFFMDRKCVDEYAFLLPHLEQCCIVLREVAPLFNYPEHYIALFYMPDGKSRFVKQKLFFNTWPIIEHAKKSRVEPVRDPYAFMFFYGLFVHKLSHFFDGVHGTRHDFFMEEFRIDTVLPWIALLESKGWDPEKLATGPYGHLLTGVVL